MLALASGARRGRIATAVGAVGEEKRGDGTRDTTMMAGCSVRLLIALITEGRCIHYTGFFIGCLGVGHRLLARTALGMHLLAPFLLTASF